MSSSLVGLAPLPGFGAGSGRPCRQCLDRFLHTRRRQRRRHLTAASAFFWQKQQDEGPPRPNEKFSREDLRRIKGQGPTLDDVTIQIDVTNIDSEGNPQMKSHVFVPPSVLGATYNTLEKEPAWGKLNEMPLNLFVHGLKERNWTSPFYDPEAPTWHLEIWKDSGRFMAPSYPGYRVVVRDDAGNAQWINVDRPGLDTHLSDHLSGGSPGAIYKYVPSTRPGLFPLTGSNRPHLAFWQAINITHRSLQLAS